MSDNIKFDDEEWCVEALETLGVPDLLTLRNNVARSLNVAEVKSFTDKKQAVTATWKALKKYQSTDADGGKLAEKPAPKAKEPKAPAEPAKCGLPQDVKRPTRAMFRTIRKVKEHPGKGHRIRRWDNYTDGMTMLDLVEGVDLDPLDVNYYIDQGLMERSDPTDEEFEQALTAWYEKRGLKNPSEQKALAAKERNELKTKKADDREKVKAEAEQKRLDKQAAREQAVKQKSEERAAAKVKRDADKVEADKAREVQKAELVKAREAKKAASAK